MKKLLAATAILGLITATCDSGNPVTPAEPDPGGAPAATYSITLAADPTTLVAGSTAGSVLSVTVRRIDNGQPPADGSEVIVSTDLGNFGTDSQGQAIQLVMLSLTGGAAQTTILAGAADVGTASVLAQFDDSNTLLSLPIVEPGEAPVAAFTFAVTDFTVTFADASSGEPDEWRWDFGDCADRPSDCQSSERNPVHVYASAGDFVVQLTVVNDGGSSTQSQIITVPSGQEPVADFSFAAEGFRVTFTDASTGNPTSWSWDFGDGSASSARSPVHTYAGGGTFTVTLTVVNAIGADTRSRFVTVPSGEAPVAAFTFQVDGFEVTFADASTGSPTSWSWDFGDGSAADVTQNPTHEYTAAGTYTVQLTASNTAGSSTSNQLVTVPSGEAPAAAFTFQVDGFEVTFADASTGNPTSWSWDFGDGSAVDTAQNPSHDYSAAGAGTYTVQLTASNAAGSSTSNQLVTVPSGEAPVADFSFEVDGFLVLFTDLSTGNPTSWSWDFGDGSAVDTAQNPTHDYTAAGEGTYAVTLTVSNDLGSSSRSQFVTVAAAPVAPVANFNFQVVGCVVTFTDTSSGDPDQWSWNFGDCSTNPANCVSTQQNPAHTYLADGDFTVTLTASNSEGSSARARLVSVTDCTP